MYNYEKTRGLQKRISLFDLFANVKILLGFFFLTLNLHQNVRIYDVSSEFY